MPQTRGQTSEATTATTSEQLTDQDGESSEQKRMVTIQNQLETQLRVLRYLDGETQDILGSKNQRKLQRHKADFEDKINKVHDLINKIIELKFEDGATEEEVNAWSRDAKQQSERFERSLETVEALIEELNDIKEAQKLEEIEARENEKYERQRKHDLELEERRDKWMNQQQQTAKLPKLEITKFSGDPVDWKRFWEQFEAEVEKANISIISKYSYLREYLSDRPLKEISGLPYTEEGYETAKEMLKSRYGVESEITQSHGRKIINLPVITSVNLKKIHDFYRVLNVSVNSLQTMGKLDSAEILVRETLDKLGPIKADLTRTDPKWQEWGFTELLAALREYVLRNPEKQDSSAESDTKPKVKRERNFKGTESEVRKGRCVYCNSTIHRSSECEKVKELTERKDFLRKNKLCFNCCGSGHSAAVCRSGNCRRCGAKHHTSICTSGLTAKQAQPSTPFLLGAPEETIHPTVVVRANGELFRALLDTGAGSSFASSTLINHTGLRPTRWESKSIETMTATVNQKMAVYDIEIESIDGQHNLNLKVSKLDRPVLTTFGNPRIRELKKRHSHLQGLHFDDEDDREKHPIHLILGAGDIARIKLSENKVGEPGQPIAEKTTFGWTLSGPGADATPVQYFTRSHQDDYRQLYSLDVLGLEDEPEGSQGLIHDEFKEQLQRLPDGRYSTGLPWKLGHPPLLTNKGNSNARFKNLISKLERKPEVLERYHNIIQEQIKQGIVEEAPKTLTGEREYYMPHKPVIKETAETTKIRIVFDASAKERQTTPSLNECLHKGPPLQPLLHSVLVRNRFKPIALTGDIQQAFHQIWVDPKDRDVLRFFWVRDLENKEVITLRQTRVPFGSTSSPFLLGGTLKEHLENCREEYPATVEELERSTYVDDLISGGVTVPEVQTFKEEAIELFAKGGFPLHKWHSNKSELEELPEEAELTFAKEQLGTAPTETKILGRKWDKVNDTLAVDFKECKRTEEFTKRGMLRAMAKVYDPLGLTSPVMLTAKNLYRLTCEQGHAWDAPLRNTMEVLWKQWLKKLPEEVAVPRCVITYQQEIKDVELHGFGDASVVGCSAVVYAVIHQEDHTTQRLVGSKSRIAKKDVSIPRLELISGHMVANLLENIQKALKGYKISKTIGWLDSTVALFWIKSKDGEWKQFVSNRVTKIREKQFNWRHCPTAQNPADVGSRGASVSQLGKLWWNGPSWLSNENEWPNDITVSTTKEVTEERKVIKQLQTVVTRPSNGLVKLLEKYRLWKLLRITAWLFRFIHNANKNRKVKKKGALTTGESQGAEKRWTMYAQKGLSSDGNSNKSRLILQTDPEGVLRCRGRITGEPPVMLPSKHPFTKLVIEHAHAQTFHGGVGLTMAKMREKWWVEKLRSLVKSMIHRCSACMRYRAKPLPSPTSADLPEYRTTGTRCFETVGVDYAGPISYKVKKGVQGKSYVVLYTCAASRAVHLDLVTDMTAETFKQSLAEFIARRGNPKRIVSDNAKTFVTTAKWLSKLKKDPVLNDYLARHDIIWQFNLSRSPWWGGFFERMVGLMKNALRKAVGQANLSLKKLREVLLDVEVTLNNRPLGYLEDDVQLEPLTPNKMLHGANVSLPEDNVEELEGEPTFKSAKYIKRCKDVMWNRWSSEYVKALRERHRQPTREKPGIAVGGIVIIKGEEKNRGIWKMGAVVRLIKGRDGVVRGAVLKTAAGKLERPLQHLYRLELSTKQESSERAKAPLNPNACEFKPRPQRESKRKAIQKIRNIANDILDS